LWGATKTTAVDPWQRVSDPLQARGTGGGKNVAQIGKSEEAKENFIVIQNNPTEKPWAIAKMKMKNPGWSFLIVNDNNYKWASNFTKGFLGGDKIKNLGIWHHGATDALTPYMNPIYPNYPNGPTINISITGEEILNYKSPKRGGDPFEHSVTDNYLESMFDFSQQMAEGGNMFFYACHAGQAAGPEFNRKYPLAPTLASFLLNSTSTNFNIHLNLDKSTYLSGSGGSLVFNSPLTSQTSFKFGWEMYKKIDGSIMKLGYKNLQVNSSGTLNIIK